MLLSRWRKYHGNEPPPRQVAVIGNSTYSVATSIPLNNPYSIALYTPLYNLFKEFRLGAYKKLANSDSSRDNLNCKPRTRVPHTCGRIASRQKGLGQFRVQGFSCRYIVWHGPRSRSHPSSSCIHRYMHVPARYPKPEIKPKSYP